MAKKAENFHFYRVKDNKSSFLLQNELLNFNDILRSLIAP